MNIDACSIVVQDFKVYKGFLTKSSTGSLKKWREKYLYQWLKDFKFNGLEFRKRLRI
jgi:hypothetical protein